MIFLKILMGLAIAAAAFFVLTFTVYFFNLDMKAVERLMPLLAKHYDKVKREKRI